MINTIPINKKENLFKIPEKLFENDVIKIIKKEIYKKNYKCEWGTACEGRFIEENELYDHVIKV